MTKIVLNITLTLLGPILTQSSTPGDYGLDVAMARMADGKPYLPGTLIVGKLRQAWNELKEVTSSSFIKEKTIDKYLGKKSSGSGNLPNRKIIQISDFVANDSNWKDSRYRIRIDAERGSVATGAYLVIDSLFAPGEQVKFSGTISYFVPDGTMATKNARKQKEQIERGLRWITSFGAQRTVGFGRLIDVEIQLDKTAVGTASVVPSPSMAYFRLYIKPHGLFCIAKRRIDKNLFESEEIIPGGTIKGGLASTWGMLVSSQNPSAEINRSFDSARAELAESFDRIRISHAFPVGKKGSRPVVAPLSLVKNRQGTQIDDAALWDAAKLIDDEAPQFSVDWKDSSDVMQRFGWPQLERELRVRTAMDRTTRKSKDEKLFAYEMIVPNGHTWEARLDFSRVDPTKRDKVIQQLLALLVHGLNSWSKTKTAADVWVTSSSTAPAISPRQHNGNDYYLITLQTPALLCDPQKLNESSGREELLESYRAVWDQLSDSSLCLERYFAQQSLAGGEYLHNRFQTGKPYYPWLLTDAGSIFVFSIRNSGKAAQKVKEWYENGLPLPVWAETRYERKIDGKNFPGGYWKCCPYIPENGYGEIAVNLDLKNFPVVTVEGETNV